MVGGTGTAQGGGLAIAAGQASGAQGVGGAARVAAGYGAALGGSVRVSAGESLAQGGDIVMSGGAAQGTVGGGRIVIGGGSETATGGVSISSSPFTTSVLYTAATVNSRLVPFV